jgi:hypothetical protein
MQGRQWNVKKDRRQLWLIAYSVVGLTILMLIAVIVGTFGK